MATARQGLDRTDIGSVSEQLDKARSALAAAFTWWNGVLVAEEMALQPLQSRYLHSAAEPNE